jgi:hypothetical protein
MKILSVATSVHYAGFTVRTFGKDGRGTANSKHFFHSCLYLPSSVPADNCALRHITRQYQRWNLHTYGCVWTIIIISSSSSSSIVVVVVIPNVPSPRYGKAQTAGGKDGPLTWMYCVPSRGRLTRVRTKHHEMLHRPSNFDGFIGTKCRTESGQEVCNWGCQRSPKVRSIAKTCNRNELSMVQISAEAHHITSDKNVTSRLRSRRILETCYLSLNTPSCSCVAML